MVDKLIYLPHTRPDIIFLVSVVSQFMHSLYEEHLKVVYRILRYLKTNPKNAYLLTRLVKGMFLYGFRLGRDSHRRGIVHMCQETL